MPSIPSILNTYNPSILAIPAYYILAVVPHAYAVNIATQGKPSKWDNRNPRSSSLRAKLRTRLDSATFAQYERAEACHANWMENLPLFSAAIILGNVAGLKKEGWGGLTAFAGMLLAVRMAYTGVYLTHTTQRVTLVRSLLYNVSVGLCFRVFFMAAKKLGGAGGSKAAAAAWW
jgi:uncharacterized MAPEG superfamily protein